jgi:hypothetical protein
VGVGLEQPLRPGEGWPELELAPWLLLERIPEEWLFGMISARVKEWWAVWETLSLVRLQWQPPSWHSSCSCWYWQDETFPKEESPGKSKIQWNPPQATTSGPRGMMHGNIDLWWNSLAGVQQSESDYDNFLRKLSAHLESVTLSNGCYAGIMERLSCKRIFCTNEGHWSVNCCFLAVDDFMCQFLASAVS